MYIITCNILQPKMCFCKKKKKRQKKVVLQTFLSNQKPQKRSTSRRGPRAQPRSPRPSPRPLHRSRQNQRPSLANSEFSPASFDLSKKHFGDGFEDAFALIFISDCGFIGCIGCGCGFQLLVTCLVHTQNRPTLLTWPPSSLAIWPPSSQPQRLQSNDPKDEVRRWTEKTVFEH